MKAVSYDPYNTAEPSGSLSGTSCPPQPHLEVMRTFLMYLETFPRGDHSMKVSYCNPLDTPGPSWSLSGPSFPPQPIWRSWGCPILDVFRDISSPWKFLVATHWTLLTIRTLVRNLLSFKTLFGWHKDTPILDVFSDIYTLRLDWSTKVVCCDQLVTCGRLVCYVCVCVATGSFILEISTICSLQ